jgi:hypothetical protein
MRIEDRIPYLRGSRAVIMRVGTVTEIDVDNAHVSVSVTGTPLIYVATLRVTGIEVGATVLVLLDRGTAFVIGAVGTIV